MAKNRKLLIATDSGKRQSILIKTFIHFGVPKTLSLYLVYKAVTAKNIRLRFVSFPSRVAFYVYMTETKAAE